MTIGGRTLHGADVLLAALGIAFAVSALLASGWRNDMDIFMQASCDLLAGENVYTRQYNNWYSYFYSPLFALLLYPLALLPAVMAKLLWNALALLLIWRTVRIVLSMLPLDGWPARRANLLVALAILFCFQAIRDNLNAGQTTPLLLWACVEGLHQARSGRAWIAALILGLAIDAKLLPLILLP